MRRVCTAACLIIALVAHSTWVSAAGQSYLDVSVRHAPRGAPASVRVLNESGRRLLPVGAIAAVFGFSVSWDMLTQRLSCARGADTVRIVQDVSYCMVNDRMVALGEPVRREGGELYLPLTVITELFGSVSGRIMRWSSDNRTLGLYESAFTVISAACRTDSGMTRVTFTLAESTVVTLSQTPSAVVVSFAAATIDTGIRLSMVPCGVIDSISIAQRGSQARVTLAVREALEPPVVRVTQRGTRAEVTLRPKRRAQPIADSVLFGRDIVDTVRIVVIDPGHGGRDPGAVGPGGTQEKDITLKVALKLRDKLKRQTGLKVYMTRDTDVFVPLNQRTKFANSKQADIFISIHANAVAGTESHKKTVRGYKMFFLSQAKSEEDQQVAMMENAVIELEGAGVKMDYLQSIITDMVANEYLRESQDLSIMLAESFATVLSKVPRLHTGVGQANFYVLNGAYMPSVLVEMAFISNPAEEKLITTDAFQNDVAEAIFRAVVEFKSKYGRDH